MIVLSTFLQCETCTVSKLVMVEKYLCCFYVECGTSNNDHGVDAVVGDPKVLKDVTWFCTCVQVKKALQSTREKRLISLDSHRRTYIRFFIVKYNRAFILNLASRYEFEGG